MTKIFNIEVDCINCASKIEKEINNFDFIKNAKINFFSQTMLLEFDDTLDINSYIKQILKKCKKIDSDFSITNR